MLVFAMVEKFRPCIIVPCFNHSLLFADVAKLLGEMKYPVIVVDDGSNFVEANRLCGICSRYNFVLVRSFPNRGKGYAMQSGFFEAIKRGYTHALQIDADGQHCVADIEKFFDMVRKNPNCIINGVPVYDETVPLPRLYGRKITNFWVWVETFGAKIGDAMCGFRVYPLNKVNCVIKKLCFYRMGFDIEILVKSIIDGIKSIDVFTKVIYPRNGISHFKMVRDNVKISLLHCYLCGYAVLKFICKIWRCYDKRN